MKAVRAISHFVVLFGFWLLLSTKYHLGHSTDRFLTACGLLSCILVAAYSSRHGLVDEEGHPVHLALRGLRYIPWLFWQIVLSNWDVFKRVWSPARPISPCMVRVSYRTRTDLGTVVYANSITLTPGTVTVDVDTKEKTFLVHCLTEGAGEDLKKGGMDHQVRRLEGSP
jgi:multicomponent Na+:H+ antiporter subunit E